VGKVVNPDVPIFESEGPEKKRCGVTVVTKYGRAVTFGVSQDRTEHFLKAIAQRKDQELTAAMQAHKAAQIEKNQAAARKTSP